MPLLISWTETAMADVDEIIDYIFADNPAAALDLEQLIHDSVNHLTRLPYIGRRGAGDEYVGAHFPSELFHRVRTR